MGYKRIKRGQTGSAGAKGGPNDKGTFKSRTKIGEATAKRMQDKLGSLKKYNKKDEEEIASNDSDDYVNMEPSNPKYAKRKELVDDPFLQVDADAEVMTVEEKRLKMANQII